MEAGVQFAVLYRPNSRQLPTTAMYIYSSHLCFHPWNHNHNTKDVFMGQSVPVSLCALFNPLEHSIRYSNAMKQSVSQPETGILPNHVIFVSKMFLTPKTIKNLPIPTPTQIIAWNIVKAAMIIRQIGQKFGVTKPSMWMICHRSSSKQLQIWVATTYVYNRAAWQNVRRHKRQ